MRFFHRGNCGCPRRIVHPTRHKCVHRCTENVVEHVHPVHTTVVNHHLERNRHVFPHSTSVKNDPKCVDEYGGGCQMAANQYHGNKMGSWGNGMMNGGYHQPDYHNHHDHGCHHSDHHNYHGHGHHPHPHENHFGGFDHGKINNWKKPNNWC